MMKEILRNGPVSIEFQANGLFSKYQSGILSEESFLLVCTTCLRQHLLKNTIIKVGITMWMLLFFFNTEHSLIQRIHFIGDTCH